MLTSIRYTLAGFRIGTRFLGKAGHTRCLSSFTSYQSSDKNKGTWNTFGLAAAGITLGSGAILLGASSIVFAETTAEEDPLIRSLKGEKV